MIASQSRTRLRRVSVLLVLVLTLGGCTSPVGDAGPEVGGPWRDATVELLQKASDGSADPLPSFTLPSGHTSIHHVANAALALLHAGQALSAGEVAAFLRRARRSLDDGGYFVDPPLPPEVVDAAVRDVASRLDLDQRLPGAARPEPSSPRGRRATDPLTSAELQRLRRAVMAPDAVLDEDTVGRLADVPAGDRRAGVEKIMRRTAALLARGRIVEHTTALALTAATLRAHGRTVVFSASDRALLREVLTHGSLPTTWTGDVRVLAAVARTLRYLDNPIPDDVALGYARYPGTPEEVLLLREALDLPLTERHLDAAAGSLLQRAGSAGVSPESAALVATASRKADACSDDTRTVLDASAAAIAAGSDDTSRLSPGRLGEALQVVDAAEHCGRSDLRQLWSRLVDQIPRAVADLLATTAPQAAAASVAAATLVDAACVTAADTLDRVDFHTLLDPILRPTGGAGAADSREVHPLVTQSAARLYRHDAVGCA